MKIIIVNTGRFGDIVQSFPLIKGLKKHYNNAEIFYLLLENFKEPAELNEEIDEIIPLNLSKSLENIDKNVLESAFFEIKNVFKKIDLKFDLLINLSFSKLSAIISSLINAKDKRGFILNDFNEFIAPDNWSKFFLSIVDYREYSPFNLVDIFSKIGGVNSGRVNISIPLEIKNIGFQLGASTKDRRWPVKNFAELARLFLNNFNTKIFLFGSKSEIYLGDEFEKEFSSNNIVNLIGKTSIKDLYNLIKEQIDILITNDTGTMHLAWYAGKKVIELSLGPALYNTTGPYGENHIIVQPDIECSPCSYQTNCLHLKCHELISPEVIYNLLVDNNFFNGNVKIFKSYYDEDGFLSYKKIYGNKDFFISNRDKLKRTWLNIIEKDSIEYYDENKNVHELNILIDNILKNVLAIIEQKDFNNWEKILSYEDILKETIFTSYKKFIPFFKYFEFLKNFNEEIKIVKLLKIYENALKKLKFAINNFS